MFEVRRDGRVAVPCGLAVALFVALVVVLLDAHAVAATRKIAATRRARDPSMLWSPVRLNG
jgi:hypothetical protein